MPQTRRSKTGIGPAPWHGGIEELRHLIEAFLGFQETARSALLSEQAAGKAARQLEHEERMERAAALFEKDLKDHDKSHLASLLKEGNSDSYSRTSERIALETIDPKLTVTYKEFDTRDSGTPEDVMKRLHVIKQVAKVSLEFGRLYGTEDVGALLTLDERGAELQVAGDEMFVNAAVSRFKQLFGQQRPKFWWLRSPWFLIPFSAAVAIMLVMLLVDRFYPDNPGDASWWTGIVAIVAFYVQWYGIRWLVPAFELIPAGEKSRSQWALAAVGAIAASMIASALFSFLAS